jgi:hypothetical protein
VSWSTSCMRRLARMGSNAFVKRHLGFAALAATLLVVAPVIATPPPADLPRIESSAPAVQPRVAPRTTLTPAAPAPAARIPTTIRLGNPAPRAIVPPKEVRVSRPVVVLHTASDQDAVHQELGPAGPLGAYGPLGVLGPIGKAPWNPSALMRGVGGWHEWSRWLTAKGGPLSENGPLSEEGSALSQQNLKRLPEALRPGGEEAAVGPSGPLGPHGALGALGPMGAHGYASDRDGNYRDGAGHVVRDVEVHYGHGTTARYELFEVYSKQAAMAMPDNDTSFMVNGATDTGRKDQYSFTSHFDQYVMVSVVPEKSLDNFGIEVRDAEGHVLAVADSKAAMNSVQVKVPAETKLTATVFLNKTSVAQVLDHSYRLSVVGSENHTTPAGGAL